MRAITIREWGGPEVLELREDAPEPDPGEGHVLIRVTRAGLNFADTHARDNSYLARYELPLVPGAEVAGVVERDAGGLQAGQRVVALVGTGGYAEYVAAPLATTFAVPDGISDGVALSLLLQGLTAWHLYRTSAIRFLNTLDNGVTPSAFSGLSMAGNPPPYDIRVRGMVAMLLTLQRFQEQ